MFLLQLAQIGQNQAEDIAAWIILAIVVIIFLVVFYIKLKRGDF